MAKYQEGEPVVRRKSVVEMMRTIPPELEKEWRDAFAMFDRDGNGTISFDEMANVMRVLGNNPTDEELDKMMDKLDEDKNGTIEIDEFLSIMNRHWKDPVDEEKELLEAFKIFDRNGDGFVEAEEIKYVMRTLGRDLSDEDVCEIIGENDADGDGKLNYHEFVKVMQDRS